MYLVELTIIIQYIKISCILNTDQSNIWERQRFTGELDRLHKKLER